MGFIIFMSILSIMTCGCSLVRILYLTLHPRRQYATMDFVLDFFLAFVPFFNVFWLMLRMLEK